jgi:predicted metallopeptidase
MNGRRPPNAPPASGIDFTARMRRLCADMAGRLAELRHVDVQRIGFSFAQARNRSSHGLYAALTPMRFPGGALTARLNGHPYATQRLFDPSGRELLYILNFYLPRFLDIGFEEKLATVMHELWHISPSFDGDLRRHGGRCYAHTRSQGDYDAHMAQLAKRYLQLSPPESVYAFLRRNFAQLQRDWGGVFGTRIAQPRLIALEEAGRRGAPPVSASPKPRSRSIRID